MVLTSLLITLTFKMDVPLPLSVLRILFDTTQFSTIKCTYSPILLFKGKNAIIKICSKYDIYFGCNDMCQELTDNIFKIRVNRHYL